MEHSDCSLNYWEAVLSIENKLKEEGLLERVGKRGASASRGGEQGREEKTRESKEAKRGIGSMTS